MWFNREEVECHPENCTLPENVLPALTRSNPVWVPYQVESYDAVLSVSELFNYTYGFENDESALYHIYNGTLPLAEAHKLRRDRIFKMRISTEEMDSDALKCEILACYDFIDPADGERVFAVMPTDCHDDWSLTLVTSITNCGHNPPGISEEKAMAVILFKPGKQKLAIAFGEPGKHHLWDGSMTRGVWSADCMKVYFICDKLIFNGNRLEHIVHHRDKIPDMESDDEMVIDDEDDDDDEDDSGDVDMDWHDPQSSTNIPSAA